MSPSEPGSIFRAEIGEQPTALLRLLEHEARLADLRRLAESSDARTTVRRIEAIMRCRERLAASVAPLLAVEELTLALAARAPAVV